MTQGFIIDKLVDAGECIDTMNGMILRFYDCYLKNEGEFSVE